MKSKIKKIESQKTNVLVKEQKNDLLQKLFEVEEEEKEENTVFLNRFKQIRDMNINGTTPEEIKETTGETPKNSKKVIETPSLPNHLTRFVESNEKS